MEYMKSRGLRASSEENLLGDERTRNGDAFDFTKSRYFLKLKNEEEYDWKLSTNNLYNLLDQSGNLEFDLIINLMRVALATSPNS